MKKQGFTFVEMMVALSIFTFAGSGIYLVLRTGMLLFAKNSAINLTHQNVRVAMVELQHDLHGSVSIPQLVNSSGVAVTGTGPAAGVSFRKYAGGPFSIVVPTGATISGALSQISIVTGSQGTTKDFCPQIGQRFHIQVLPTQMVELDITGVGAPTSTSTGTAYTLTLGASLGTDIQMRNPGDDSPMNVACFLTSSASYIVENGRLIKKYLAASGTVSAVVAASVTTNAPFFIPTVNGSINTAYIGTSNFGVTDNVSSNLNFHSSTFSLSLQTPHWSQMTANY